MLVILFLIFINFIILFIFGRYIGSKGMICVTGFNFISSIIYAVYLFILVFYYKIKIVVNLWSVCFFQFTDIKLSILMDELSVIMFLVVLLISGLVHCYSASYMKEDPYIVTFFSFLSLFTFFMLILVSSANLIQLFFGWEGIGLCSYLLVGFWSSRLQANRSALKAVIVNRVGDVFFILGLAYTYIVFYSFDLSVLYISANFLQNAYVLIFIWQVPALDLICFCFMIAAIAKSAQFGLHTWLPDAMEGPTPVSALIHAATMVTAGIYLLNRLSFLLFYAQYIQACIIIIGSLTIVFAASSALFQNDIKKIIAYSTCSQLGYMFLACGLLAFNASFFHLVTHAVFKALLFLGAGSVIHSLLGEQDIRRMGLLINFLPITYIGMSIGSLALAGLPFLAGFYSKETILWALANSGWISLFALCCSLIGAVFTVMYSVRLLYVVFFCSLNSFKVITKFILESDYFVIIPLFILSLLSLIIGFIGFDFFIGTGSNFFVSSLIDVTLNVSFIPYKSLFLMFFISTLLTFFIFYKVASTVKFNLQLIKVSNVKLFNFLSVKWYIDYLYNILVSFCGLCSYYCFLVVDRSVDTITGMVGLLFFYNVKTWFQKYTFYVQLYMNLYVLFTIVVILLVIIQYSIY